MQDIISFSRKAIMNSHITYIFLLVVSLISMPARAMDAWLPENSRPAETAAWQISVQRTTDGMHAQGKRIVGSCAETIDVVYVDGKYTVCASRIDHASAEYGWAPQEAQIIPDASMLALLKARAACAKR